MFWKLVTVCVMFIASDVQANKACKIQNTGNYSVIGMCNDGVISGNERVYLDAFVPAKTTTKCICSVTRTPGYVITINWNVIPDKNCSSTLLFNHESPFNFTCKRKIDQRPAYTKNVDSTGFDISLETSKPSFNINYCVAFYNLNNSGIIRIQCYSPNKSIPIDSSTSSATSSTNPKSSSTLSPETTGQHSTTKTETVKQTSNVKPLPVAAIGGATGGVVVLMVVVVVILSVVFKRRRQNNKQRDNVDRNVTEYCNVNPDTELHTDNDTHGQTATATALVLCIENELYSATHDEDNFTSPSNTYSLVDEENGDRPVKNQGNDRKKKQTENENEKAEIKQKAEIKEKAEINEKAEVKEKAEIKETAESSDNSSKQTRSQQDDDAGLYAAVNKDKKGRKDVAAKDEVANEPSDLYAVVDKSKKKNKRPTKTAPSGDVYTLVQKPNKSQKKDTEA